MIANGIHIIADAVKEVETAIKGVSPAPAMSTQDIADALGKAKGTAVLYYQRALEAAREVARELGEDVP